MGDNRDQVQPFTQCVELPPATDSGVGPTAESSPCTEDPQVQGEVESKVVVSSALNTGTTRPPYLLMWDADRKRYVVDYHQRECVHNEPEDASRTVPPIECTDKCHQGELVSPG